MSVRARWGSPTVPSGPKIKQPQDGFYFCTCDCYDFRRQVSRMAGMNKKDFESRKGRLDQLCVARQNDDGAIEWMGVEHNIRLNPDIYKLDRDGLLAFSLHGDPWRMFVVTKTTRPYKDPEREPKITYHLVTVTFEAQDPTDWACKHTQLVSVYLAGQRTKVKKLVPVWLPGRENQPVAFINGIVGVGLLS